MKKGALVGLVAASVLIVGGCMNSSKGNRASRYPSIAEDSQQLRAEQRELSNDTQQLRKERAAAGKRAAQAAERGDREATQRELRRQTIIDAQIRNKDAEQRQKIEDFNSRRRELERQWGQDVERRERRY